MTIPSKPGYIHGSAGTQPSIAIDYKSGDPVNAAHFDYFIDTEFDYIKSIIDALNAIDSNDDGKVDAADFADNAANATSTFKSNDIVDSNGVAFNTERVEGADGNFHSAGSLPQFSGTSTALNNTSEANIFYITADNSVYMNNGGSAINLTKKFVDILVNGGLEASFEQYDTNGSYDVSVSEGSKTTSMYYLANNGSLGAGGADGAIADAEITVPGSAPSSASASASIGNVGSSESAFMEVNGSTIISGSGSWSGSVNPGDTFFIKLDLGSNTSFGNIVYDIQVELIDGANLQVDGVTQTTSN